MNAHVAPVMLNAQRYQRLVVALTPAACAQVMKLYRAGVMVAMKAQAGQATQLRELSFVDVFGAGHFMHPKARKAASGPSTIDSEPPIQAL